MAKKPRTRTIVPGSIQLNTDNVKCLKIHNNNNKKKSKFTWDTVQVFRRTFAKNGKFEEAAAGMAFLGWTIIIIIQHWWFSGGHSTRVALPVYCFQVELQFGMLVFVEGGKPEDPEKNPWSKDANQQQTKPACDARSGNRTRATVVGGERSCSCSSFFGSGGKWPLSKNAKCVYNF